MASEAIDFRMFCFTAFLRDSARFFKRPVPSEVCFIDVKKEAVVGSVTSLLANTCPKFVPRSSPISFAELRGRFASFERRLKLRDFFEDAPSSFSVGWRLNGFSTWVPNLCSEDICRYIGSVKSQVFAEIVNSHRRFALSKSHSCKHVASVLKDIKSQDQWCLLVTDKNWVFALLP